MACTYKCVVALLGVSIFSMTASNASAGWFGSPREKSTAHNDSARHRTHGHSEKHSTDSKGMTAQKSKQLVGAKK
jgi:hypothetical protein